jgi:DNA-binding beta-propeller fold protein YncE
MRDGIQNNLLLVVGWYRNYPGRHTPRNALPEGSDQRCLRERRGGGISVLDLSTLKVVRRVEPSDIAPRGLAVTFDGKYVITSNKRNTSDGAVFSTPSLRLLRRIHIGESPAFIKINPAGDRLFATFEPSSGGGPPGAAKAGAAGDDVKCAISLK